MPKVLWVPNWYGIGITKLFFCTWQNKQSNSKTTKLHMLQKGKDAKRQAHTKLVASMLQENLLHLFFSLPPSCHQVFKIEHF